MDLRSKNRRRLLGRNTSTLGGMTFCPKKYVSKINKMPEFYMIHARKISKIGLLEFL